MLRRAKKAAAWLVAAAVTANTVSIPQADGKDLFQSLFRMQKPATGYDPTVEQLAEEIDWLEKHIDAYGSVVAKQPDVWGQARMTKHRQEFEREMYKQLGGFELLLQGTVSRSDQAFLANSFALSAAVGGAPAAPAAGGPSITSTMLPGTVNLTQDPSSGATTITSVEGAGPNLFRTDPSGRTITSLEAGDPAAPAASARIALEPTIALDQRARYLNHLHELRRLNEGDDTADSPGYALNLVRIPISVLPGKWTRAGFGAEIAITARPYLSEALLPITFRNLVINDVVDQLGLPITRIADVRLWERDQANAAVQAEIECLNRIVAALKEQEGTFAERARRNNEFVLAEQATLKGLLRPTTPENLRSAIAEPTAGENAWVRALSQAVTAPREAAQPVAELDRMLKAPLNDQQRSELRAGAPDTDLPPNLDLLGALQVAANRAELYTAEAEQAKASAEAQTQAIQNLSTNFEGQIEALRRVQQQVVFVTGPASRSRQARNPIPPTQVATVLGHDELIYIAEVFHAAYQGPNVRWNGGEKDRVLVLDVQKFLQAETEAAYDLLSVDQSLPLWNNPAFLIEDIATAVLSGDVKGLGIMRNNFFTTVGRVLPPRQAGQKRIDDNGQVVKTLAWVILVEAALLNHQLVKDMHLAAESKGCGCACGSDMMFYLPQPSPEACQMFNEYVRCRWPIHIFALDPSVQQQNIADSFSRRRELQMALSLGFLGGQINAQELMQFARRLETDIETVALNETVVGFSHGDDTFGWRFYPRLQSPPTKGTIATFGETLFGGPRPDSDLLHRKIEPGMRECVALVIMPSFVPYVTVETRSSWFRLNAHSGWLPTRHKRETSMVDIMKLSRSVRSMHEMSAILCDSEIYRPGDVELLMNRVHQLDRQLPMQGMVVQVPIENTLGGFQMFQNGVTDLAPELQGWYGAPGIRVNKETPAGMDNCTAAGCPATPPANYVPLPPDCNCKGTTLFLVGDHFSVHDTKVIAGGICIPADAVTLLSRQVMRVTVPGFVNTVEIEDEKWVDIHVATPYGVTNHLHVPVIPEAKPKDETTGLSWESDIHPAKLCFEPGGFPVHSFEFNPSAATRSGYLHIRDEKLNDPLRRRTAQLVVQLQVQKADKTLGRELGNTSQLTVTFNDKTADVPFTGSGNLAEQIRDIIAAQLTSGDGAVAIVGHTFLNFDPNIGNPWLPFDKDLQIPLTIFACPVIRTEPVLAPPGQPNAFRSREAATRQASFSLMQQELAQPVPDPLFSANVGASASLNAAANASLSVPQIIALPVPVSQPLTLVVPQTEVVVTTADLRRAGQSFAKHGSAIDVLRRKNGTAPEANCPEGVKKLLSVLPGGSK